MPNVGYHASHEQFRPSELLTYVRAAEQAGFGVAMSSDHFHPWSEQQGNSGFTWSWLGAAMQATKLPFGVVSTPGYRYHPAVLAQACATLAEMFPGRFWVSLGSGESLNEHITGEQWPTKSERNARLKESVDVIRALWAGETVTHHGRIHVEDARLYVRPAAPPLIIGAALTPSTAAWLGGWADGLITINQRHGKHRDVVTAFRNNGGEGKPVYLQVHLSYAEREEDARQQAYEQWRTTIFESPVLAELRMPGQFEAAAEFTNYEDVAQHVRVSSDLGRHIAWLGEDLELGLSTVYLHNVGRNQAAFIEAFGRRVLPALGN